MIPLIKRLGAPRPGATPGPGAPEDDPRPGLGSWIRILPVEGVVALAIVAAVGATRARPVVDQAAGPPARATPATLRPAAPAPVPETAPREVALYAEPQPDDFRPEYDRDTANRGVETWDIYWGWVNTYYRGNFLARGWAVESRSCLAQVADPAARRALTVTLNELGRLVAGEWAKNKAVRKITTDDVKAWGHRLEQSRRDDDGTGVKLLSTVRTIRAEAKRKLGRKDDP